MEQAAAMPYLDQIATVIECNLRLEDENAQLREALARRGIPQPPSCA